MSDYTIDLIGDQALMDSIIDRSITEIKDANVTSIGNYAFDSCSALTSADFPNVTNIGQYAFRGCNALTTVDFSSVTSIGIYVFYNCSSLTSADFSNVTKIGPYAFDGCSSLTALILRSSTMTTLNDTSAFTNTPIASGTGYIYVPSALVASYQANSTWSNYSAQFRALEDYTVDGTITGELDPNKI